MANNPAQDRYDPPNSVETDWEKSKFMDLSDGSLFWLSDKPEWNDSRKDHVNEAYRKLDDKQALNTTNQIILDVLSNIDVYVKI